MGNPAKGSDATTMGPRSGSAPDMTNAGAGRRPTQPSGGNAETTPYMKRKVVDKQEVYRRQQQKGMNQLPPVNQPAGGASLGGMNRTRPSAEEKRFRQSIENLAAGRDKLEQQGFDMGALSGAAAAGVTSDASESAVAQDRETERQRDRET